MRPDRELSRQQGYFQNFADGVDKVEFKSFNVCRFDGLDVTAVFPTHDYVSDSRTLGCQDFFLYAADGKYAAAQGDFAGHGYLRPYKASGKGGGD